MVDQAVYMYLCEQDEAKINSYYNEKVGKIPTKLFM